MDEFDDADHQNKIIAFIQTYDQISLLKVLGGLQLSAMNQGKDLRFETLINDVLRKGNRSDRQVSHGEISDFFATYFRSDYMEDPINTHFSENVVYYGGNYTLLPGINTDITLKLKAILHSIFMNENGLSPMFKTMADHYATVSLMLSKLIMRTAGIGRYELEENDDDEIFVPTADVLQRLSGAIAIKKDVLQNICNEHQIPLEIMNDFMLNGIELPEDHDPYQSIFTIKPFFEHDDELLCLFPSNIGFALYTRIRAYALEIEEETSLRVAFHQWQADRIVRYAKRVGWMMTSLSVPENPMKEKITEQIYQIDRDKLAYICLINDLKPDASLVHQRIEEVVAYLGTLNNGGTKVLSVLIGGGFDNESGLMWMKPAEGNLNLVFSFSDYEIVMESEDPEPLMLWKFAKAFNYAATRSQVGFGSDTIDLYAYYKNNNGSLLPSDDVPGYMVLMGAGAEFVREHIAFRDEHGARQMDGDKLIDTTVTRTRKFAPLYKLEKETRYNANLLEVFDFPLWIISFQAKNQREHSYIGIYVEAVAFWMFRLSSDLADSYNTLGKAPIEVRLELDTSLLQRQQSSDYLDMEVFSDELEFTVEQRVITIFIPFAIAGLFYGEDNSAERQIMKAVLSGFNVILKKSWAPEIASQDLGKIISAVLRPTNAKMILFADSSKNPFLDNRDLPPTRFLMNTEQELIADHLVEMLNPPQPIPAEIAEPVEKNKLCMSLVGMLLGNVEKKLSAFNTVDLLRYLVTLNERLIFQEEYHSLLLPAKIACYSNFDTEVMELKDQDKKRIHTAIAIRGIIEFIVASPRFDGDPVNMDDIDEIIALMDEAIFWANVADSITLLGNNPEMGLLPSGRLGIRDNFMNEIMRPFNNSRAETEVFYSINPNKYEADFDEGKVFVNNPVTDAAFVEEWGASFTTLTALYGSMQIYGLENDDSFVTMSEEEFFTEIPKKFAKPVNERELKAAIDLIALDKRKSVSKAPEGFIAKDILPWRYNRALSYIRRPLVRITYPGDPSPTYHWGFRHTFKSYMSLTSLISANKLKVQKEGPIESRVMSIFVKWKGRSYRNEVFAWLKDNTKFRLIDYEVQISDNGHLVADKNYGDIDIMAIDDEAKIIYSIECKNTASARVIHEMKTELDNYIGQDGQGGHILKHLNRHKWLNDHKDQLIKFVADPDNYRVISFVLSSNVIPAVYLARNKAALPILSFRDMVRDGFNIN